LALLIGAAALILQLVLSPLHASVVRAPSNSPQSAALTALAQLAALSGEHNVLCADADGGPPGDPAHGTADCTGLCCHLSHGVALFLAPPAFSPAIPSRMPVTIFGRRQISSAPSAHSPNAQPRGPPLSA
jgi:hypothetical protein